MKGDYGNARIYKIEPVCDHQENEVYYGSTCQSLSKRMAAHRGCYKRWCDGKHYKTSVYDIFELYGVENCKIILVESYPCESKEELEAKEAFYIRKNLCVNKIIPGRTRKVYCYDNKEKIAEYQKVYHDDNKEIISVNLKAYYRDNKEKISEIQKAYRQNNKELISTKGKVYYNDNKEKLNAKHICLCGGKYTHSNRSRHETTKKHQKFLTEQDINDDEQDD